MYPESASDWDRQELADTITLVSLIIRQEQIEVNQSREAIRG